MRPVLLFLIKGYQKQGFADSYPSFLWNLLAGNYNAAYSGGELWCMIPSTMRPWWICWSPNWNEPRTGSGIPKFGILTNLYPNRFGDPRTNMGSPL